MRGCKVVLYVAVLLCFLNSAFAALDCGVNGDSPKSANVCVCKSGFSTGSVVGQYCDVAPDACNLIHPLVDEVADFPHLIDNKEVVVFKSNTLFAKIGGLNTANRTFLELNFEDSTNEKCSFGTVDSFWRMTQEGCNDTFSLALPWKNHTDCGFAKNDDKTTVANLVISGYLHLAYKDLVYVPLGVDEVTNESLSYMLERRVSVPYQMHVVFQKTIEVKLLALNITSDVNFGAALTGDEYNPDTRELTLTFTTLINFPNSFKPSKTALIVPEFIDIIPGISPNAQNVHYADASQHKAVCPPFEEKPCEQNWVVVIKLNDKGNCTFDGNYTLSLELYTCRDPNDNGDSVDCTFTTSLVNFTISSSDTCGQVGITPSVGGELVPFYAKAPVSQYASTRKDNFKLGEYANFYAKIDSDGNDIYVNFTDVRFKIKGEDDNKYQYLYQNKAHVDDAQHNYKNANLTLFHSEKYFRIYFHSSVFKVAPQVDTKPGAASTKVTYTFSATVEILFEGNQGEQKKRSVEYTFDTTSMSPETNIYLSAASSISEKPAAAVTEPKNGLNQVTFVSAVVGAIAGTMIIVFVVIGVALRSRSQSAKRDAAASAAVVAANAAAQSIEVVARV